MLNELVSLRFIETHCYAAILRPVGAGRTSVATALGHVACQHGCRVKLVRADDMLRSLRHGRFDNCRDALMISLMVVDLLIRDDFTIEVMTKEEIRDDYQLFLERTGTASRSSPVAVTRLNGWRCSMTRCLLKVPSIDSRTTTLIS